MYGLSAFMIGLLTWLALRWYDHRETAGSNNLLLMMIYLLGLGVGFHLGSAAGLSRASSCWCCCRPAASCRCSICWLMSVGLFIFLLSTSDRATTGWSCCCWSSYLVVVAVRALPGAPLRRCWAAPCSSWA